MNTKVKDLIRHLKKLDQEALVVTSVLAGGYQDVKLPLRKIQLELDVHKVYWLGPHIEAREPSKVKAYIL